jgi:hypothetical protein
MDQAKVAKKIIERKPKEKWEDSEKMHRIIYEV